MREALAAMTPPNPRHPPLYKPGRPKGLNYLGVMARHHALTKAWHTFNGHILLATTLEQRERELIVLRISTLRGCDYEWAQHVVLSRDVGLSDEEILRVRGGGSAAGWSSRDALLLTAVDELIAGARISGKTWADLSEHLEEQQLLDLVFTVGCYDIHAMVLNSVAVELDEDLHANGPLFL
jgi:AhpD family alkylhydroperoxidase